ncbi:MAG: peptidase T, partial [Eubacteriales bacterium]
IGFTPDEEIGRGADRFDVARFGADYAYTLDGGALGEVEYETFNAASMKVAIKGRSIHPGSAKGKLVNACCVALEFDSCLPPLAKPEYTEGREGFIHMTDMRGEVGHAELSYIIRDHDAALLECKKAYARRAADMLNAKYGEETITLDIRDSYRNMGEMIKPHFHLIETAYEAVAEVGAEPVSVPVRGGTDGSRLSFMGLPCPNLGVGAHNGHGCFEYVSIQAMDKCVDVVCSIARRYAEKRL